MWMLCLSVLLLSRTHALAVLELQCRRIGQYSPAVLSRDGDFLIGGVFNIHYSTQTAENYTTIPQLHKCKGSINLRNVQYVRTLNFAIEEINNSTELLPGISLGYQIHDSCGSPPLSTKAALQLANGQESTFSFNAACMKSSSLLAVIGESASTNSIAMSRIFGLFGIPQISPYSTCACLSDKKKFPTFLRTIPSDYYQAAALARLVKHFGWTWIGAVRSDNDYGNNGMAAFLQAAQAEGICVEYSEAFARSYALPRLQQVAEVIRRSTARVVVAFVDSGDMSSFMSVLAEKPMPAIQWVATEAWVTDPLLAGYSMLLGTVGVAIPRSVIPGLREFLLSLGPSEASQSPVLKEFWESTFSCSLEESVSVPGIRKCNGTESIRDLKNPYTDASELRINNMVYKAMYAVAHALHNLLCINKPVSNLQCDRNGHIEAGQFLEHLRMVNFTRNGYPVSFDANGDPVATYELLNWQISVNGKVEFVLAGHYDASAAKGQVFNIYQNITWAGGMKRVPVSVCSESCPPGTRKAVQKGRPICCYDCVPCPEGEISNTTDSLDCIICPTEYWPNSKATECVNKETEFLSFSDILGIILAACSVAGAFLSVIIAAIFYRHKDTPIVRANNSELSFLLLFSLILCFLCSLTFIGRPSQWSCMLRHTAFGITFVLCISCVLGKTVVVLMAFRATLPGTNVMKWFGPIQQRLSVVFFTFIQLLICTLWLAINPPFPIRNFSLYKEKIILECNVGSTSAFWAVLGYIGVLSLLCFILAFLARKLPDNFNEAKFITFSMLIFCAVWITFIPAYVSSPGKFTVAVEIFAILASSFALIVCIFFPKCFIILFRPDKNTKKHMMGKVPSKSL